MCLSTAIAERDGSSEKICEYVSNVRVDGKNITFTDVMGVQTTVKGTVKSMDLIKNVIVIEA